MPKVYEYGEAKEVRHNRRWVIAIATLIGIALSLWLYMYLDTDDSLRINNSENRAVTSEYAIEETPTMLIEEATYSLRVPEGWKESDRYLDNGTLFVQYRGPEGTQQHARRIDVYSGGLPNKPSSTRLLAVAPRSDGTIKVGSISDRCHTFTESDQQVGTPEPEVAKWNDVTFMCNFSKVLDSISAGSTGEGQLMTIAGKETKQQYYFRYTDQNTTTNFEIFKEILRSFQAK